MPATNTLTSIFTAIANAIRGKNGLSTQYQPADMAAAITAIPSGGGDYNAEYDFSPSTSTGLMSLLKEVDVSSWDRTGATSAGNMFSGASKLERIVLGSNRKLVPSTVTDMSWMFYNCKALEDIDLSLFDVSNVTTFYNCFNLCSSLSGLDTSSLNISNKATNFQSMFYDSGVTEIDASNWDMSGLTSSSGLAKFAHDCPTVRVIHMPASLNYVRGGNTDASFGIGANKYRTGYKDLEYLIFDSPTPPTLSSSTLFGVYGQSSAGVISGWYENFQGIFVPDSAVSAYASASNWSVWANYIKPKSQLPPELQ